MFSNTTNDKYNDFYCSALDAAQRGPKVFAKEFEKKEVNANATFLTEPPYGDPLIHAIIKSHGDTTNSNDDLVAILTILVENGVDLESRDLYGNQPLALAAEYLKKIAVEFLIKNKAKVNDPRSPALIWAMSPWKRNKSKTLDIIKFLLAHDANINIISSWSGVSPLGWATASQNIELMTYLISHGASIFLKEQPIDKSPIVLAYLIYREMDQIDRRPQLESPKMCLDLLLQAAVDYLYHQATFVGNKKELTVYLESYINNFAGNFNLDENRGSSDELKILLKNKVLDPVLTRIHAEREPIFNYSGKIRFWGEPDPEDISCRNQVRASTYPRG